MSAALSGSYSLSANQIGLPVSMFTIHKQIFESYDKDSQIWLHPKAELFMQYEEEPDAPQ